MAKYKLWVNRTNILDNRNDGGDRPTIVINTPDGSKDDVLAKSCEIHGPCKFLFDKSLGLTMVETDSHLSYEE